MSEVCLIGVLVCRCLTDGTISHAVTVFRVARPTIHGSWMSVVLHWLGNRGNSDQVEK